MQREGHGLKQFNNSVLGRISHIAVRILQACYETRHIRAKQKTVVLSHLQGDGQK
jgi:hypothetical protein